MRLHRQHQCRLGTMLSDKVLSYIDLADAVGVGENTVGQWVTGKTVPSALVMDDVCGFFACTLNDIYPQ